MQFIKAFDYKTFPRVESPNGRKYQISDDLLLPSVTTILSSTADHSGLDKWAESIGQIEAERIKNESATLGTEVHTNLERYILNEPLIGSFMSKTLAKTIIRHGLNYIDEIWGSEVSLYYENLWAGTTDGVGKQNGTPIIIDFKNSRSMKEEIYVHDYYLQLCAYILAHNWQYNTNISKGIIMIATRDAKYQEFILEGDKFHEYSEKWLDRVTQYHDKYQNVEKGLT